MGRICRYIVGIVLVGYGMAGNAGLFAGRVSGQGGTKIFINATKAPVFVSSLVYTPSQGNKNTIGSVFVYKDRNRWEVETSLQGYYQTTKIYTLDPGSKKTIVKPFLSVIGSNSTVLFSRDLAALRQALDKRDIGPVQDKVSFVLFSLANSMVLQIVEKKGKLVAESATQKRADRAKESMQEMLAVEAK